MESLARSLSTDVWGCSMKRARVTTYSMVRDLGLVLRDTVPRRIYDNVYCQLRTDPALRNNRPKYVPVLRLVLKSWIFDNATELLFTEYEGLQIQRSSRRNYKFRSRGLPPSILDDLQIPHLVEMLQGSCLYWRWSLYGRHFQKISQILN
jgi:hypothetical protein